MTSVTLRSPLNQTLGHRVGSLSMWNGLARDRVLRTGLVVCAAVLAPLLVPVLPGARETYSLYAEAPLIVLAIAAFQLGLRRSADTRGRLFWNLWTAAFALWLALELFDIWTAGQPKARMEALLPSALVVGLYLLIGLALEVRPDSRVETPTGAWERQMRAAGTICLSAGLFLYFAVLPTLLVRDGFGSDRPWLLRLALECWLVLRLLGLHRVARGPFWKATYSWLLAAVALWALADGARALAASAILPRPVVQGLLEVLWLPPLAAVFIAARLRENRTRVDRGESAPSEGVADFWDRPLLFQAAALPLVHVGLSSLHAFAPAVETAQQACAFAVFLVVGGLALLYQRRLEVEGRRQEVARLGAALAEHRAFRDALTGLPNRYLLLDHLKLALAQARREQSKVAVLFLDIDRFKLINDSLGHTNGDQLLQAVAARIQESLREADTLARIGGDEFTVIIPGIRAASDAAVVPQKLLECVRRPFVVRGAELFVTASIGVSLYPDDAADADSLVKNADAAVHRAKELGGDGCQLFNPAMNEEALERLALESALRKAVAEDQFVLYYQPVLDVATGRIDGCEALLRWRHPEMGLVGPPVFMELAEVTGVISRLTPWILWTACHQARIWQARFGRPLSVAVNLSARQFRDPNLVRCVDEALREAELDPGRLELEITESLAMENAENTVHTLRRLKDLGVWISIDDFGTGYSSLSYLKAFPIDTLKIDKSFVRDIDTDAADAAIAATVLAIARTLKLRVVAEGVEREEQFRILRERECDRAQGYLFGRPVPAEEFGALLASEPPGPLAPTRAAGPAAEGAEDSAGPRASAPAH